MASGRDPLGSCRTDDIGLYCYMGLGQLYRKAGHPLLFLDTLAQLFETVSTLGRDMSLYQDPTPAFSYRVIHGKHKPPVYIVQPIAQKGC
ncbi:hypothetical protein RRG08_039997 [Elysia crispata]|uniref:Uncharacterized protein n=1 Tax=Elysia crispata TaxID=231223 RepID=A0AAE1DBH6_9GAST|nr:hypothetical protein RRG08_039997 [Elysia crispata]